MIKTPEIEEVKMAFSVKDITETPVDEIQNITLTDDSEQETTVEFDLGQNNTEMFLFTKSESKEPSFVNEPIVSYNEEEPQITKKEEEKFSEEDADKFTKKHIERVSNLREMSQKIKNQEGLMELEKVPAYIRRQTQLENTKPSSDSEISNLSVGSDDNNKTSLRKNPFFHDKPD